MISSLLSVSLRKIEIKQYDFVKIYLHRRNFLLFNTATPLTAKEEVIAERRKIVLFPQRTFRDLNRRTARVYASTNSVVAKAKMHAVFVLVLHRGVSACTQEKQARGENQEMPLHRSI